MSFSPGFTASEVREFVHEYHLLPFGQKAIWLAERGVSYDRLRRWRSTVFEGDVDRGLVPRDGVSMTIPPGKRTAFERARAKEVAAHQVELDRLQRRVKELEASNDALGKAIGLLHSRNEQEPDAIPPASEWRGSSTPSTPSSPS